MVVVDLAGAYNELGIRRWAHRARAGRSADGSRRDVIGFRHCDPRWPFLRSDAMQPAARWHAPGDWSRFRKPAMRHQRCPMRPCAATGLRMAHRRSRSGARSRLAACESLLTNHEASGEYATEREVIRDGLRALMARDQAVDAWLRTKVASAYDALKKAPSRAVSASEARARLSAARRKRSAKA
jgi:Arc/MetJ-type ribon-helix-helix transcriptional regulator